VSEQTQLYDTGQVAAHYGLSEVTLRKWRITGRGPRFVRVGRAVRYSGADLDAFLSGRAFTTTGEADLAGVR